MISVALLLIIGNTALSQSQGTYVVTQGSEAFSEKYQAVINKTNWDKYRARTVRRVLHFENGFTIELFSASELDQKNIKYNNDIILADDQITNYQPKYFINESGNILELHTYKLK